MGATNIADYANLSTSDLIAAYQRGAGELREATAGMTDQQLRARVAPGKWSTLEVLCHLADFEVVNAERIRRIISEDEPTILNGEPDDFERGLVYEARDPSEELTVIETIRHQTARILRAIPPEAWRRRGNHSTDGPLTLRQLIERVTRHIPHHIAFIEGKRQALDV